MGSQHGIEIKTYYFFNSAAEQTSLSSELEHVLKEQQVSILITNLPASE